MYLPEEIFRFISVNSLNVIDPAFIKTNESGEILEYGGEVEKYSLLNIKDKNITEVHNVFEGYLPLNDDVVSIPMIEIKHQIFVDVYIIKSDNSYWFLILDNSTTEKNIRSFLQKRNDEKLFMDKKLNFGEDPALLDILRLLNIFVLEWKGNDDFKIIGKVPKWALFLNIKDDGILDNEHIVDTFPFIEIFLNTAYDFWENNNTGTITSDLWEMDNRLGRSIFLEATALSLQSRKFLLIQHSSSFADEKRTLIQRARELSLEQELRIKAEKALSEKNRKLNELNATKDKFFSIIAHDLRNPLSGFRNLVETFSHYYDEMSEEMVKELIKKLDDQSLSIIRLLENLLQWSRTQMGNIQLNIISCNIAALINTILKTSIDQIAASKNIKIIKDLKDNVSAEIDEDIIGFVIRNLLTNAVKFSYENSEIRIIVKKHKESLSISIKDSGVGIRQENINKLFKIDENFTQKGTQNEHGSGLGLILCKEFINLHNGTISVESEFKKGTSFSVNIPLKNNSTITD